VAGHKRELTDKEKLAVFGPVLFITLILYLIARYSRGDEIKSLAWSAIHDHTTGLAEGLTWLGL